MFCWLEFVWLPSLFTGFLFRGGLLVRLFGLTFVNGKGEPASSLRVLCRMILSGVIPISAAVCTSLIPSLSMFHVGHESVIHPAVRRRWPDGVFCGGCIPQPQPIFQRSMFRDLVGRKIGRIGSALSKHRLGVHSIEQELVLVPQDLLERCHVLG